jgi:hypothetical protein
MMGPSFHVPAIESCALFGREHRANLLARGVHDRAQRSAGTLPEAVDLHAPAREHAVHARTLQRIESELLAEVTIALGAKWRAPMLDRRAPVPHVQATHGRFGDHSSRENHQEQQSNGDSAAPRPRGIAHGCT